LGMRTAGGAELEAAMALLNSKRDELAALEKRLDRLVRNA